jgi:NADH-quinone oxidoreductase subunit H
LLGAFRAVAQIVSYEVPMVIALLIPVILAGSMSVQQIVEKQTIWFIVMAPVTGLILLISTIAELGRAPFDLIEAESEIIAGFHIEYTGMKFAMFYAGELLHALTLGAVFACLFLGGWRGPGVQAVPILGVFWLLLKAMFMYWVIMWVKYTVPRIRIDHMLSFNWKFLTPLSLVALIVTAIMDKLLVGYMAQERLGVGYALGMLIANLVIVWATLSLLRTYVRPLREPVAQPRPIASPDLAEASEA